MTGLRGATATAGLGGLYEFRIAVVGIACRHPDANSPDQLWENVMAGRRAFRRLPDERLNQADYYSPDPLSPDRFYSPTAAVIEGWTFDPARYGIDERTFRSTDSSHWLPWCRLPVRLTAPAFSPGPDCRRPPPV